MVNGALTPPPLNGPTTKKTKSYVCLPLMTHFKHQVFVFEGYT